jgi:hypothetical protein
VIQRSLGIIHDQPKAVKPLPKVSVALPISGCTLLVQFDGGPKSSLDVRQIESVQFAERYLKTLNSAALEQSDAFRSRYKPMTSWSQPGESAAQIASDQSQLSQLNMTVETQALSETLAPILADALAAKGLDTSVLSWSGWNKCPGGHS